MSDLLSDLTDDQRQAVEHGEGPLLILAAAGSGKTRVITRRVAHLLQQGISPRSILAITFTNKAAGEMRQRIDKLAPGNRVQICTFHSFGARFLREYADRLEFDRNFTIYDTDDSKKLVKQAIEAADLDSTKFSPDRIRNSISRAKNQLMSPQEYARKGDPGKGTNFFTQAAAMAYANYEKRLRDANAVDFDDLLYLPALALIHNEELREEIDARYRYVLIDEYQDTNAAQYEIARRLSVNHQNICVVGDPDQSIYRWRGSDIKNILDFERDFSDARIITLGLNYRSSKAILHAAAGLIAHNKQRKDKPLVTENDQGEPVRVLTFDNGLDEADLVVQQMRDAVEAGKHHYRDFAVFIRVNALTRTLESAFIKHGVPFQIVRGLAFFDRKENRDVLAYLRLLVNPKDDLSFTRAVNEPARGVGKTSLGHLQSFAEPRELSLMSALAELPRLTQIKGKAKKGLREFGELMAELRKHVEARPDEVIRQVLDLTGIRNQFKDSSESEDQDRLANIEELITAAKQFADEDPSRTIADFLEQITLASDVDAWDEQSDCVSVMTLHAAKGLEFPVVYLLALEQGLLPHERSLPRSFSEEDTAELEEERRLCFVGMTRAKLELYMCHSRMREFRGQTLYAIPSQFLEELPEGIERVDLSRHAGRSPAADAYRGGSASVEEAWAETGVRPVTRQREKDPSGYEIGMAVEHEDYGRGRVTDINGYGAMRKIKIRFATAGVKTFVLSKVRLKVAYEE